MSKGLLGRGEVGGGGGGGEGEGEGWRVVFELVELATEVVDGAGEDMLEGSMVTALLTSAGCSFLKGQKKGLVMEELGGI